MGTRLGLAVVGGLLAAPPAAADDGPYTQFWRLREISFPVPVDKFDRMDPRPAKVRFLAAADRGPLKVVAERAPGDLDQVGGGGKRGFRYTAADDGEYDFAVQLVFPDGDTQPPAGAVAAEYRIVFDTRPPVVRVATPGPATVEWAADDDNPDPDGIRLDVRWAGTSKWKTVDTRTYALKDRHTWQGLTAAQPLDVRVVARDRGGLEAVSRVVTLPAAATRLAAADDPPVRAAADDGPPPARPHIDYFNTPALVVDGKLTKVTRSGVREAHLWVNDGKGGWRKAGEKKVAIPPGAADPAVQMTYQAARDGLYGFIVIPVSGAGTKQDDPRPADQPQFLIEVDTQKPFVEVTRVIPSAGGAVGPRVEIQWKAEDKNLLPEPITLEYATAKDAADWKPVTPGRVPNTGRYVWEVEDKSLWKFWVRVRAVDKASNAAEAVSKSEVVVDLDAPLAEITRVQQDDRTGRERPSDKPPVEAGGPPGPVVPGH